MVFDFNFYCVTVKTLYTIMQSVLGGSLHKNNTVYLLLGLYHASVNRIFIVLLQITPQEERYYGICASSKWLVFIGIIDNLHRKLQSSFCVV